jgi:hypothetical protein
MLTFKQSEPNEIRRRWMFQLIGLNITDETPTGSTPGTSFTLAYIPDPNTLILTVNGQKLTGGGVDYTISGKDLTMVTTVLGTDVFIAAYSIPALTGQTGYGYISKNGAAAVQTSNQMVEIDATNMPGFYYISLTAAELNTLGHIGLRVKTTQSLNYEDKALITYDDPYAFHGGFPIGGVGKSADQKLNWKKVMEMIRKVVKEELSAFEIPKTDIPDYGSDFKEIKQVMKNMVDKDEETHTYMDDVKGLLKNIKLKDYSSEFVKLSKQIEATGKMYQAIDVPGFAKAVKEFENKMSIAAENVSGSVLGFSEIQKGFSDLQKRMDEFTSKLSEMNDMDKRFDAMSQAKNNAKIEELTKEIKDMQKKLMATLINYKYDVLKQLK